MFRTFVVAVLLGTSTAALADDAADPAAQQSAAEESMLGMLTMKAGAEASEADRGYMKAMQATQQNLMKTEMSGDAGGDFLRVMITQQQSVIDMADVLLAQKDVAPELRSMAEKVKADRKREMATMQAWLEAHPQ